MAGRSAAAPVTCAELRHQWWRRAERAGWNYRTDWHVPAVDAVCEAIVDGRDVFAAAERLGRTRAVSGAPLGECLADVDELAALVPAGYVPTLHRAVSLGWADQVCAPPAAVSDALTGLASAEYLQVRLGEVYRAAEVAAGDVSTESALVVVRLDLRGRAGWSRALPMMLTAECLRTVFDGGESHVQLAEGVAVVLTARDQLLARRARLLANMIVAQVQADPQATVPPPEVWIEHLPAGYTAALNLIDALAR